MGMLSIQEYREAPIFPHRTPSSNMFQNIINHKPIIKQGLTKKLNRESRNLTAKYMCNTT
jgi:hypothetical protein